jgi:hypothetical protein
MTIGDIRLLSAIEAIYDAASEPSRWKRAISEIVAFLADVGGILQWRMREKTTASFGTIATESLAEAQRDYVEGGCSSSSWPMISSTQLRTASVGAVWAERAALLYESGHNYDIRDNNSTSSAWRLTPVLVKMLFR